MKDISRYTGRLKVALIGCGGMGRHHLRVINSSIHAELIALCDTRKDIHIAELSSSDKVSFFIDAEELLKTTNPDVVHIVTPPSGHASLAKLSLEHDAHVYVEKPFCLTKSDADAVIRLANQKGLKVCAGHQVLFEKAGQKLCEYLKIIGKPVHVESYFSFRTVRRSISPVEQLIDILPHPTYLLLHVLYHSQSDSEHDSGNLVSVDANFKGDIHAIIKHGDITGILTVTLRGRPVESYLKIVGTNGCIVADFVLGAVVKLPGPGVSAVSIVLNPYSQAKQMVCGTTKGLIDRLISKQKSYPGLSELVESFYMSLLSAGPPPLSYPSIVETVSVCEEIGRYLRKDETESEKQGEEALRLQDLHLPPVNKRKGMVVVTGGTGFLGRKVVSSLRNTGLAVRLLARRIPYALDRLPGVDYVRADLSDRVQSELLRGTSIVVHCAAETAGGKNEHQRNSINTVRNMLIGASEAGVKQFIHISSVAVLKTSHEIGKPVDETAPMIQDESGPYAWGKAESERMAFMLSKKLGIDLKVIRLAPLVHFGAFQAPGRLGRELGPFFIAVGDRAEKLNLCEVDTAAKVIRYYVSHFDRVPKVLNLIEPHAPTRAQLVRRLLNNRLDLTVIWLPMKVLTVMSSALKIAQRLILNSKPPIDIKNAFISEKYDTHLAEEIVTKVDHHTEETDSL